MNIYPWHLKSWTEIFSNKIKMPHAYIFYGAQTPEINKFADEVVKTILCSMPTKENFACGECQDCLWCEKSHPDVNRVVNTSEEKNLKTDILKVANVREAKEFLQTTSHQANGKKIVTIYGADRLNLQASNAILKIVEEPPADCLVIFTVNNLNDLLPTIISRCRLISLSKPSNEDAKSFLKQTNNSDLINSLNLYNNSPLELISEKEMLSDIDTILNELKKGNEIDLMNINNLWLSNGLAWIINLLQKWSYEILLYKLSEEHNYFPGNTKVVHKLALNADLSKLLTFQKSLNTVKSYAQTSANKEINLNSVMIEYKKIFIN
jgi:DNA polymerase-3 subunit delta'